MNHYVHVYRTNIDGLITDRVVRYCCQNPNFRNICIQRPLKTLSRKLLPAHWQENRDDQPRTVGVSNYIQVDAIINLGYFKKDPSPVAAGQRHFLC